MINIVDVKSWHLSNMPCFFRDPPDSPSEDDHSTTVRGHTQSSVDPWLQIQTDIFYFLSHELEFPQLHNH